MISIAFDTIEFWHTYELVTRDAFAIIRDAMRNETILIGGLSPEEDQFKTACFAPRYAEYQSFSWAEKLVISFFVLNNLYAVSISDSNCVEVLIRAFKTATSGSEGTSAGLLLGNGGFGSSWGLSPHPNRVIARTNLSILRKRGKNKDQCGFHELTGFNDWTDL